MSKKHYLKIFNNLEEYDTLKDKVMNKSHVVLLNETKNIIFKKGTDYSKQYFTIEALEDGLTASLSQNASEYRIDNGNWVTLASGTTTPAINVGQKISFKMTNPTISSSYGIGTFTVSKAFNVEGNIMSLLYGDGFIEQTDLTGKIYAFRYMFQNCTTLQNAEDLILPATTLAQSCYMSMFNGCTSLTTVPVLPATTLAIQCYYSMFNGCNSLTTAPELSATTLANWCYCNMFKDCTNLTSAPELHATTLASECYYGMFQGCTSLTEAPELPATTLASGCYRSMFDGCTSLTEAPELPATTLAERCYQYMFQGCTSLTEAPRLLATTLAKNCYQYMFHGCTSLTTAPELQATTLAEYCYSYMFYNCSNLNYIKMLATNISASYCLYNWVSGVASSGTFIKHPQMTSLPSGASSSHGIPYGWTVHVVTPSISNTLSAPIDFNYNEGMFTPTVTVELAKIMSEENILSLQPMCDITVNVINKDNSLHTSDYLWVNTKTLSDVMQELNISNINDVAIVIVDADIPEDSGYYYYNTIEENPYSKEFFTIEALGEGTVGIGIPSSATSLKYRKNNESWTETSEAIQLSVVANDTIQISCVSDYFNNGCSSVFAISTPFNVEGNIMSLLYGDDFQGQTDLSGRNNAFRSLFFNCTTLQNAEKLILPATTLANNCYNYMFQDCTSLTTAPELPATTLADNCCDSMFYNCTSLTTAPELPATTLTDYCYNGMFQGCTSLTSAPELPATTLEGYCYYGMFQGCKSLTTAPELPATTLVSGCYGYMFKDCSKLNNITMLATNISAMDCLYNWVKGVASSGAFVKHKDMASLPTATSSNYYKGIPDGWTVENA